MHISKFLYNRDCSAETNVFVDINEAPCLDWKISLPSNPSYAVETMAVWDKKGNLYLGCHNGNFYSICENGSIRFSFQTNFKIFSTPLVFDNYVFFCSGDGFVYCLSCEGVLLWKKKVSSSKLVDHKKSIFEKTCSKLNFKVPKKSIGTIRTWASLNIDFLNRLFITTAEEGLVVLSIEGHILKKIPLKFKYPLAGVVFFNDGSFVLPIK